MKRETYGPARKRGGRTALIDVPNHNGAVTAACSQPVDACDRQHAAARVERERLDGTAVYGIRDQERSLSLGDIPEPDIGAASSRIR